MSATSKLGAFVAGLGLADVPEDVVAKARCALVHNLSVAAAGGILAPVAAQWAAARTGGTGARALISGLELAPADAAFANGCLVHARAQDDVYFPGLTHVGATTIPAVLALAEQRGSTLGEVLLAIVAGYEVACAVSTPTAQQTTGFGFRASGIYGVFGSAAACAKLLALDAVQSANAIAIAASFAAGTNQTWVDSSQEWQFEVGQAARSGLEAALLAAAGGVGAVDAFEGASGFYAAFARDADAGRDLATKLGRTWFTRAVNFKPYPVCAILQAPVVEAIKLHSELAGAPFVTASIRLSPPEAHYPGTEGSAPFEDPGAALMSASYCLAVALTEGTVSADDLFRSHEDELRDRSHRIKVIPDESLSRQSFVLDVDFGAAGTRRVEHVGDGTTFNWQRAELEQNVQRLAGEVPEGIDLDVLVERCFADFGTPATSVVDAVINGH
ncbi:MmgE/PrpD family protein [Cryobacterium aureum]|uniref:MmgE/PrpD family protein n=1 Tax=Cryobacterium aureum TaxID=995037 RepID=UPI000CF39AA7|nr:MmgE/PrpD family protein [Cryobacterium aureum]